MQQKVRISDNLTTNLLKSLDYVICRKMAPLRSPVFTGFF